MEDDPDVAGVAGEVGGKVGPAGLGQQGGPVPLRDGQVVPAHPSSKAESPSKNLHFPDHIPLCPTY